MAEDIVDFMMQQFRDAIPELNKEQVQEKLELIETTTRKHWGGEDAYIAKKKINKAQVKKAVTEYLGGKPFSEIRKETGVGRATIFRHMKKGD